MNWTIKKFNDLSTEELYETLQLRSEVFVVEQNCVYQDLDGYDTQAFHLFAKENEVCIAYARIFNTHIKYRDSASIGRVVIKESKRNLQIGRTLMQKAIAFIIEDLKSPKITISAQKHLAPFYESLGFISSEKEYLEDGIPHVEMNLKK